MRSLRIGMPWTYLSTPSNFFIEGQRVKRIFCNFKENLECKIVLFPFIRDSANTVVPFQEMLLGEKEI